MGGRSIVIVLIIIHPVNRLPVDVLHSQDTPMFLSSIELYSFLNRFAGLFFSPKGSVLQEYLVLIC